MGFISNLFGSPDPWKSVGSGFTNKLRAHLNSEEFSELTEILKRHRGFDQSFFQNVLPMEPDASFSLFPFFLGSLGNQLVMRKNFADAEKAMRISLKLQPEDNPAAGSLAILLKMRKHYGEASEMARKGLQFIHTVISKEGELPQELRHSLVNSDQTIAELELIISGLNTIRAYKSELLEEGYERLVSLAKRHFRDRAKSLGLRFVESEVENEPIFVSDIAAIGNTAALAAVMAISENKEFWAWMYFDVAATLLPENVKALYASAMCYFAVGRSIEKPEYVSRAKVLAERALSKIHSLNYYEIFVGGVNTAQATKNLREIVSHG